MKRMILSPWYLNTRRLALLARRDIGPAAQLSLIQNSSERADAMWQAAQLADRVIASGRVQNLTRTVLEKGTPTDRILGSLWAVFTFRGLPGAIEAERRGKPVHEATFSGSVPIGSDEYRLVGQLSNDHVYSSTAVGLLSKKRRAFLMGMFEFRGKNVEVFPYVIGELYDDLGEVNIPWRTEFRVYPEMIDSFERIRNHRRPTATQVQSLLGVPEQLVKEAFAEIVGEPFVPKDWAGERSDLYTSRLLIDGNRISTAFIFKGPGTSGAMYPASLGKRGDQLVRAFDEPADLIILQHHSRIDTTVIRQAEALAADPRRPRRYCAIDGADTWRILKAYKKLPPKLPAPK